MNRRKFFFTSLFGTLATLFAKPTAAAENVRSTGQKPLTSFYPPGSGELFPDADLRQVVAFKAARKCACGHTVVVKYEMTESGPCRTYYDPDGPGQVWRSILEPEDTCYQCHVASWPVRTKPAITNMYFDDLAMGLNGTYLRKKSS